MKQIYNFEPLSVPVVTEEQLLQRRQRKRQWRVLLTALVLLQVCVALLAVLLRGIDPIAAAVCAVYVALSLLGMLLTIPAVRKRKEVTQ